MPPSSPSCSFKSILIEDLLEDVLEAPIVGLEDGVLGAHVEGPLLLDGVLEAAVREARDGLQGKRRDPHGMPAPPAWPGPPQMARHATTQGPLLLPLARPVTSSVLYMPMPTPPPGKLYTSHSFTPLPSFGVKTILNVPDLPTTKSVALYCEGQSRALGRVWRKPPDAPAPQQRLHGAHLVAVGMSADGDGLGPAGHQAGDVLADDGLPEDRPPQDVSDSAVGALPHLLQLELWGTRR